MNEIGSTANNTLYGRAYFAHPPDSFSFDQVVLPEILAEFCVSAGMPGVVDIGAGNGMLGQILRKKSLRCLDVDINDRSDADFLSENLTSSDPKLPVRLRAAAGAYCDGPFLVSCLDMAEHVDIEHLADFIYNLASVIERFGIISISTRPSSRANLFHASILPIDTWKYMFDAVGLKVTPVTALQKHRSEQQFRSDSQELLAVSHWQKRNIFQDDPSHQHYFMLEKHGEIAVERESFRKRLDDVLDIGYRRAKRTLVAGLDLPVLVYHVLFVQDWPFLRSMLDLWPAGRVRVLIRPDLIVPGYRELIESFLRRLDVPFATSETIAAAEQALYEWQVPRGSLFVTATEGLPTFVHGLGSLVSVAARRRGLTTVCLQHGHDLPGSLVMGSQFFGAVDLRSVAQCESALAGEQACRPLALGSLKHLDTAIQASDPDALPFRLGGRARHFRKRLLIGTNLHWTVHCDEAGAIFSWLRAALLRYPDILFVLRPHPDDYATFSIAADLPSTNLAVVDEAALLCIDWPVSRLLQSVDAVLSTPSTLIEDALVARRPTAILSGRLDNAQLAALEADWRARGALSVGKAELAAGEIPMALLAPSDDARPDRAGETINMRFYHDLCALAGAPDRDALVERAEHLVERSFLANCRHLNLDSHPNSNRQRVVSELRRFVCESQ